MRKYIFITLTALSLAGLLWATTPQVTNTKAKASKITVQKSEENNTTKSSNSGTCNQQNSSKSSCSSSCGQTSASKSSCSSSCGQHSTSNSSCSGTCSHSKTTNQTAAKTTSVTKQSTATKTTAKAKQQGTVIHLTKDDFLKRVMNYEVNKTEWKYAGDKPCIIDYYATWCGPCKRLSPVLDTLAQKYAGQIYIYKIDIDKERELAGLFQVRSVPTLLFCPMEGVPQMAKGALPKETLIEAIETVLLSKGQSKTTTNKTSK